MLTGATLGRRYDLLRLLGQGGMGCVYEAEHRETRARVAVKVLHSHLLDAEGDGARRFQREAEAAGAIRSEHVVRVLDAGADEETSHVYLVTEYLEGEDLQRLLDRTGPLQPEGALRVAWQALLGLAEAHAARVVHRDVKPSNLFLARGPGGAITLKLLDFGVAKVCADPLGPAPLMGLTTTGGILGSPLYMSPEQVQSSRDVDHRTDIWSLGCVLYAALAGRAPHQHLASVGQLLLGICTSPPPPLSEVAPWVSPAVADIVLGALEIRRDTRWQSAAAMLDAIRRLVPAGALSDDLLAPSGERSRPVAGGASAPVPAAERPRVVVARDLPGAAPIRGDEATQRAFDDDERHQAPGSTLASERGSRPPVTMGDPRKVPQTPPAGGVGSGVPTVGAKAGARLVVVDPRRLLGDTSELWSLSLDVHRHLASLVARIYRSLGRAGAKLPPMTYGTTWVLVEARTGRAIVDPEGGASERTSLSDAGIVPGAVLWVVRLDRGAEEGRPGP